MHFPVLPVPFRPFTAFPVTVYFMAIMSCPTFPLRLASSVDAQPLGFRNKGLLSVPQIKHMTHATMLLSYCYCLSLYLLSFTYFFPH
jgi:hypothetical protein